MDELVVQIESLKAAATATSTETAAQAAAETATEALPPVQPIKLSDFPQVLAKHGEIADLMKQFEEAGYTTNAESVEQVMALNKAMNTLLNDSNLFKGLTGEQAQDLKDFVQMVGRHGTGWFDGDAGAKVAFGEGQQLELQNTGKVEALLKAMNRNLRMHYGPGNPTLIEVLDAAEAQGSTVGLATHVQNVAKALGTKL
jgi:hypothetical protein